MNKKELAKNYAKSIKSSLINKIILFGSVARNEDKKDSDIDILVVASDKYKVEDDIYSKAYAIYLEKDEHISVKLLSVEDYNYNKNTKFITTIEKEGIALG